MVKKIPEFLEGRSPDRQKSHFGKYKNNLKRLCYG